MPRQVEVKLRVASLPALTRLLRKLGARGPTLLLQTDTYFGGALEVGRIKLREERVAGRLRVELVGYRRPDRAIRTSDFEVATIVPEQRSSTIRALTLGLGLRAIVRKRRQLWWLGRDRIHLDSVRGLGRFLEIEARADRGARRRTEGYLRDLGLAGNQRIPGSYVDLMERSVAPHAP